METSFISTLPLNDKWFVRISFWWNFIKRMNVIPELTQKRNHTNKSRSLKANMTKVHKSLGIFNGFVQDKILTHFCLDCKGAGRLQLTSGLPELKSQNKLVTSAALKHRSPSKPCSTPSLAPMSPPSSLILPDHSSHKHAIFYGILLVKKSKGPVFFSDRTRVWLQIFDIQWSKMRSLWSRAP